MKLLQQCWIIYNGHLPGTKFLDFAEWVQMAANKQAIHTTIIKNNDLLALLETDMLSFTNEHTYPDFVIFLDKDIYLAKQLELLGIRVFNTADAIQVSDDKIATYQQLAANHLPIPTTIIAPKIFQNQGIVMDSYIRKAIQTLGFPMIVKEAFGSFGEQVYLIHKKKELYQLIETLQGKAFMFQAYIETSTGRDMRLHVVGGKVVAAMVRTSQNDFRANVTAGGKMTAYTPTTKEKAIAIKATKAIGADFAGVDLLFTDNETPLICEVNSNAHIHNMYDCTGINVADYMIDYIIQAMKA